MGQELISNILDAIRDTFRHLTNANPELLLVAIAAIALVGYWLLRR